MRATYLCQHIITCIFYMCGLLGPAQYKRIVDTELYCGHHTRCQGGLYPTRNADNYSITPQEGGTVGQIMSTCLQHNLFQEVGQEAVSAIWQKHHTGMCLLRLELVYMLYPRYATMETTVATTWSVLYNQTRLM